MACQTEPYCISPFSCTFLVFLSFERLPHCIGNPSNEGLPLIPLLQAQTPSNADMFFYYFGVRIFSPLNFGLRWLFR